MSETAPASGTAATPPEQAEAVRAHVTRVVEQVQRGYLPAASDTGRSWSAATLSRLRRAQGGAGSADPRSWSLILDGLPVALEVQEGRYGSLAQPTRAELAIFMALTTYAVHQQSQTRPQHVRGKSCGSAIGDLARARSRASADAPGGLDESTVNRMHRVLSAHNEHLRSDALRALVTLMRGADQPIGFDYGQLARDLYWLQFPGAATRVQLQWGRDLYRRPPHVDPTETAETNDSSGAPA